MTYTSIQPCVIIKQQRNLPLSAKCRLSRSYRDVDELVLVLTWIRIRKECLNSGALGQPAPKRKYTLTCGRHVIDLVVNKIVCCLHFWNKP